MKHTSGALALALTIIANSAIADRLVNPAPQIFFPGNGAAINQDDTVHPEWADRQDALGWNTANELGHVGTCGGVCVASPEVMEGPFYIDYHLDRSNLTESSNGVPLDLTVQVFAISSHLSNPSLKRSECEVLPGAWVDIWNADSEGVYSGYGKQAEGGPGGPGGPPPGGHPPGGPGKRPHGPPGGPGGPGRPGGPPMHQPQQNNSTFLRGVQQADSEGKVTFHTIYPGWYPGRAVHIHMKIHPPSWSESDSLLEINATHTQTTQMFFSEDMNEAVAQHPVYAKNTARRVVNDKDGLYRQTKGVTLVNAQLKEESVDEGVNGYFAVGIDKWW